MKIKKLGTQLSRAKSIILLDESKTRQWAGQGTAFYLLPENLSYVNPGLLATIIDIPPEKSADYYVRQAPLTDTIDCSDTAAHEEELFFDLAGQIIHDGRALLPLKSKNGLVFFVPTTQLSPIEDAKDLKAFLRISSKEQPHIFFKDGLFVVAFIMPMKMNGGFIGWLSTIYNGAKINRLHEGA